MQEILEGVIICICGRAEMEGRRDGYACVRLVGCAMYHVCGIRWITNNDVTKDVIHFLDARGMRASVGYCG